MLKYRGNGLYKALSIILAVAMLIASPIGMTPAYALEDEPSVVKDIQSEFPLDTSEEAKPNEILDSGVLSEASSAPAFAEGYPKLGTVQAGGSKKIEILVKGILPEGETSMGLGYVLLADGDSAPTAEQIKSAGGTIPDITIITWSHQSLGDTETTIILTGAQDDTDYDFHVVCWQGNKFSEIKHLDVKTPVAGVGEPSTSDIEILTRTSNTTAEVSAASTVLNITTPEELEAALGSVSDGGTITLSNNISYDKGIVIDAKNFYLNLGNYTLNVVNSTGIGIDIKNSILTVSGNGKLNATGTKGVQAHNSKISVYSATGTAGAGVEASCSSYAGGAPCEVTITSHAQGTTAGVYAINDNCKITAGSAKATATNGKAVYAEVGGTVEISEDVEAPNGHGVYCVNGSAMIGGNVTGHEKPIYLYEAGNITIAGNVSANRGYGIAVEIYGNSTHHGTVTINGIVDASDSSYVLFVNGTQAKSDGVPDGAYLKYMDSIDGEKAGIIRVKKVPAVYTIGSQEFTSLSEAITAAPEGETTTITLLQSIIHNEPVEINGKNITFAMGDFDLTIDTSAISNSTALRVLGDGKVNCTGSGKLHVVGFDKGIWASGGSELYISGNVIARQYAVMAGSASGIGTPKITVDGDVTVTGQDVSTSSEVEAVSVGGNVTANRTDEIQLLTAVYSNASTITIGKNVTTQGSGVNAQNGGNVTIGGALHYNPIGSGEQAYIKVGYPVVLKTADDFEPTSIKPEYKEYRNGDNVVWVKEAPDICTIGAQRFTSLDAAIAFVPAGGRATITMLQSITHTKHIKVENKTINLDLMDYDLLLDTSADGSYTPALMVTDGGQVNLIGSGTGEFNIKSYMTAISAVGINTEATVHNVEAGDSNGVYMVGSGDYLESNSTVTVLGNIKVGNDNGVEVNAKNGKVIVGGNIAAGRIGVYLWSNSGTKVTVSGDITIDGDSAIAGIRAYGDTTVDVNGNVTVRGTNPGANCVGVHASGSTIKVGGNVLSSGMGAQSDAKGKVEITGSLTAGTPFITVGTAEMTANEGIRTPEGFLLYSDGANTVQIGSLNIPEPTYTVTFDLNGGARTGGGDLTQSVANGGSAIAPTVTRSGYTFKGWDKSFTNITQNLTVTATWSYNGGGGGGTGGAIISSSDDSPNIIIIPPAQDNPSAPTQAIINLDGKVDTSGNLTLAITDKNITDAINKAMTEAKKNGNEANGVTLVLNVSAGGKTVHHVTVNLPKTVQDTIIRRKIVSTILVVDNPDIRISMDLATVQEINKQAKSDVNITATSMDSGKLAGDAKKAIGSRPAFDLKVSYGSGKQVQNFGAGSVSITIPYTLDANEKAENVQAVYVDGNGKVHWVTNSVYDSMEKVLHFATSHFSTYGIGYKQDTPDFTDIDEHWAKDDIEFVVNRGLFSGTSKTTFSPNTAMTRGMFITALGRLANADVSTYKQSSFIDVKNDAYYMGYIEWANKNNIINGIGDGNFAPEESITREQMAVVMQSYAKTIVFNLPEDNAENTFADSFRISSYAKDAVKQMQMAGVISGKSDNIFDPQGTATRAEVSAMLRRFIELTSSGEIKHE